jgi:hypothetical protein
MNRILALFVPALVLLPGVLQAYYSVSEMKADALRKDPYIRIRVHKSGDEVTFTVALRKPENPEAYWYVSLDLADPEGVKVGTIEMRGDDIRRAATESSLRLWGWENFKPAEVFQFTLRSNLLARSTFSREVGPRSDEHGMPYGGGVILRSHLQDLVDAAVNANQGGAANRSQPIRPDTNQTSAAAGSGR